MPQGDGAVMGHRHVLCDGCQRHEFPGRRYCCLRCPNYDLCGECFDQCVQTDHHLMDHPMQLIMLEPQHMPELLSVSGAMEQLNLSNCYTCPYCKVMGHTAKGLIHHVYGLHSEDDRHVVCPMCACLPGSDLMTMQNLSRHLLTNHIDYANFLEPHTPPLPRLPQEASTSSRQLRRRSRGHLRHFYQEQDAAYFQMINAGQFAADETLPDLSNVRISYDLRNNQRNLYTDEAIVIMMGQSAAGSALSPTDRLNSAPNTHIPVNPHEKRKKERRPKTDRFLLSKWVSAEQNQWEMSTEASKTREQQALFTEQIVLSMLCEEQLELPGKDIIEDKLDMKLSKTESIATIEPNLCKIEKYLKTEINQQTLEIEDRQHMDTGTENREQSREKGTEVQRLEILTDLQLLETGTNLQTLETGTKIKPQQTGTDPAPLKTEKHAQTLKTGTGSTPKISKIMSLMAVPWTQVWSCAQTPDVNGCKEFIQLMGATTEETQVDEMKNMETVD
ncbi:E3 ubiquitin-protein ligase KCMF1-like [Drosophila guanche]|uniref:E3 ubiquitin-protein ligase KCMF1 n=1 Tax=Drosophila guanche TaxID=7266 RepID=A0A3B0KU62_DROGU|nr:E3 ubiquitin-protein ligase KCMF1-like [Drosophila guanche]SPP89346.1 blast:E3 ubiquitin-protein ligase KCMF1 [Drosophila guanche]